MQIYCGASLFTENSGLTPSKSENMQKTIAVSYKVSWKFFPLDQHMASFWILCRIVLSTKEKQWQSHKQKP